MLNSGGGGSVAWESCRSERGFERRMCIIGRSRSGGQAEEDDRLGS